MVARHDDEDRLGVFLDGGDCGDGDGGRGVAGDRFENDRSWLDAHVLGGVGNKEAMVVIGENDRGAIAFALRQPLQRRFEQAALVVAVQFQELFWIERPSIAATGGCQRLPKG